MEFGQLGFCNKQPINEQFGVAKSAIYESCHVDLKIQNSNRGGSQPD